MGLLAKACVQRSLVRGRRPLAITKYRQDSRERNLGHKFLSSSHHRTNSGSHKRRQPIPIDQVTMEAMEVEVSRLMEAGPSMKRSCHVTEIAIALTTSDVVVDLYAAGAAAAAAEEETKPNVKLIAVTLSNLFRPLRIFDRSSQKNKEDEFMSRKYEFMAVMEDLQSRPESISTKVSTWEEARQALSAVFIFPDVSVDSAVAKKQAKDDAAKAATNVYKDRLSKAQKEILANRSPSSGETWKKLSQMVIPSTIADGENKSSVEASAIEKVESKLNEKVVAKTLELQARLAIKEVQELEQRLKEKEAEDRASSLMRRLTPDEQAIVQEAIYGDGPSDQVIARIDSDSVQRRSMRLLKPGQWLNDEVIHYFLVMLAKRDEELCRQDSNRKPTHFFKSFFLTKLLNEGDANPDKDGVYEYRNVRRWSKHVKGKDIFKLSKIFFPINQNQMHWYPTSRCGQVATLGYFPRHTTATQWYVPYPFRCVGTLQFTSLTLDDACAQTLQATIVASSRACSPTFCQRTVLWCSNSNTLLNVGNASHFP